MESNGILARIIGQGDNQNLLLGIPPAHKLNSLCHGVISPGNFLNFVMSDLEKAFNDAGLVLKVEECWKSMSHFIYNKDVYIGNLQVSNTMQKVMRITGFNNAISPCLESDISSIVGAAESATATDVSWICSYWLLSFHILLHITRSTMINLDFFSSCALLTIPKIVGGLPIALPINFLYRGDHDELNQFLSLCSYLSKIQYPLWPYVQGSLTQKFSSNRSYLQLVLNPFSLPVQRPPTISLIQREEVHELLRNITKNQNVRSMIYKYSALVIENFCKRISLIPGLPSWAYPES